MDAAVWGRLRGEGSNDDAASVASSTTFVEASVMEAGAEGGEGAITVDALEVMIVGEEGSAETDARKVVL